MRVWVNGTPTSHLVDDETTKGFIALQIHDNSRPESPGGNHQIRFRNIRIKTDNLKPSSYDDIPVVNLIPNYLSGQEEAKGFSLLWDGKTTNGWRGISQPALSESGWKIDRGVLTISALKDDTSSSSLGGIMRTQKKYGPFELKFDFKQHKNEGIPGIEYLDSSTNISEKEAIYGRWAAKRTRDIGRWNQGRIKVLPDNKVEYWLNGYKILEYYRNNSSESSILLGSLGNLVSVMSLCLCKN